MSAYADTSFLVSLYSKDANSVEAGHLAARMQSRVLVTPFGEAEFVNAVEQRVFRRNLSRVDAAAVLRDFEEDLASGSFLITQPFPDAAFVGAMSLSKQYVRLLGTRAMDVLHVASALELQVSRFLTFDQGQRKLARRAGLHVLPRR